MTPSFPPAVKAGGPARAVGNLVGRARQDHSLVVVTADRDLGDDKPYPGLSGKTVTSRNLVVYYVDVSSLRQIISLGRRLHAEQFDLALINSMWNRQFGLLPALALLFEGLQSRLVAFMPRGELESGALALKPRRKRFAMPITQRLYARISDLAVATSDSEKANLERYFHGVECVLASDTVDRFDAAYIPREDPALRLLFIGRIHPTKGLLELLQGMARCAQRIRLTIAGPVHDARYWSNCEQTIHGLPDNIDVVYLGVVERAHIAGLYASSDLMVSLTAGENFGHTIPEAMQVGCPVLASPNTQWTSVIVRGGGNVVGLEHKSQIVQELTRWASLTDDELITRRTKSRDSILRWLQEEPPDPITAIESSKNYQHRSTYQFDEAHDTQPKATRRRL